MKVFIRILCRVVCTETNIPEENLKQFETGGGYMGRKSTNLGFQFTRAIDACTYDGKSKRAYKQRHNGETDWHVFGYSYKNDLCETGKNFASWVHFHFPDVKLAKDIKPYMAQQYMEEKSRSGLAKKQLKNCMYISVNWIRSLHIDTVMAFRWTPYICRIWRRQKRFGIKLLEMSIINIWLTASIDHALMHTKV